MGLSKTLVGLALTGAITAQIANAGDNSNNDLTWKLPPDIVEPNKITTKSLQYAFDVFSWESFIALNWPATKKGMPNKKKMIGKDAITVWEQWPHTTDIFKPGGVKPDPWGSPIDTQYCTNLKKKDLKEKKLLRQIKKVSPNLLILNQEPMDTGPVIDQNGQYLQYEINLGKSMFDYIVDNELYNVEGQQKFDKAGHMVDFASGDRKTGKTGAIMVKAAWKILDKKEDRSKFHTVDAVIWNNPAEKGDGTCRIETVGLIGLHIATKTKSAPQWVWSTFEHVDNAPTEATIKEECRDNKHFSLYNCNEQDRAVNKVPAQPWDASRPGQTPTQVARVVPLTDETKALNKRYQDKLRAIDPKTPWQNYMLISTQWPTRAGDPTSFQNPDPQGSPAPMVLANTTLETYTQGTIPQIGTSCTECHFRATSRIGKWTDFTYTLGMAYKLNEK